MNTQNPRRNGNSKPIQAKPHKEAYIYTLTKREKGNKLYIERERNASQNYSEVSPHTGQNGHHQKVYKQ